MIWWIPYSLPRNWLVWEWMLDWNTNDSNDWTKNNGTATNVTWDATQYRWVNKYVGSFNGSSSKVDCWNTANHWTWPFSWFIWIKTTATWGNQLIMSKWWVPYISFFSRVNADWTFWVELYDWTNSCNKFVAASINDWIWHHIWFTTNWTTLTLYKDWQSLWTTTDNTTNTLTSANSLVLWWRSDWANNSWYNWYACWARIFNYALSIDEIQQYYLEWKWKVWQPNWFRELLSWLSYYYDLKWDSNEVINWLNGTNNNRPIYSVTNDFWNSKWVDFWSSPTHNKSISISSLSSYDLNQDTTLIFRIKRTWTQTMWNALFDWRWTNRYCILAVNGWDSTKLLLDASWTSITWTYTVSNSSYDTIAIVRSSTVSIYVNWVFATSGSRNTSSAGSNWLYFWNNINNNIWFPSIRDDFKIIKRALSAWEITTIQKLIDNNVPLYPFM